MNILTNRYDMEQVSLLDLFGGTGAVSYEFASRGTRMIDIVERDRISSRFISNTIRELGIEGARVYRLDVRDWLKVCRQQYDIIYADPPYDLGWLNNIPDMVLESYTVHETTLLIVEHSSSHSFTSHPCSVGHRRYGLVNYSLFSRSALPAPSQE